MLWNVFGLVAAFVGTLLALSWLLHRRHARAWSRFAEEREWTFRARGPEGMSLSGHWKGQASRIALTTAPWQGAKMALTVAEVGPSTARAPGVLVSHEALESLLEQAAAEAGRTHEGTDLDDDVASRAQAPIQ
jgi:hypothetical protein